MLTFKYKILKIIIKNDLLDFLFSNNHFFF